MNRSLLLLLCSALLTVGGCGGGGPEGSTDKRVRTATVTEQQAIELATEAVRKNDSFADSAEYSATETGTAGWTIVVNGNAGQFRLIVLDSAGEVIKYEGG